jgi:hypothetical protein
MHHAGATSLAPAPDLSLPRLRHGFASRLTPLGHLLRDLVVDKTVWRVLHDD